MATQPRLVNKQFNTPIGLYSPQNIQEVIERDSQILANGAVGINFNNPNVGKPANLKNSAVLRMLEEEENRQRNGFGPSAKRVTWPPPNDSGIGSPSENSSISAQGGSQNSPSGIQQNNYQAPPTQHSAAHSNVQTRAPLKPLDVSQRGPSPLNSPIPNQSPQAFKSASQSKGWAPVHSPVGNSPQPSFQQGPGTNYQTAHQSVTQQNYLGQQYLPSSTSQYQPPQSHYSTPQHQYSPQANQVSSQQYQSPSPQYQVSSPQYQVSSPKYQASSPQFQAPSHQFQAPPQKYQAPTQQYQNPSQQSHTSIDQYQSSAPQYQTSTQESYSSVQEYQTPQQQYQSGGHTQKIQTSYQVSTKQYQTSTSQQYQSPSIQQQQSYQQVPTQFTPKTETAPPQVALKPQTKPFEPPPTTITLRPQPPVSQAPPPVFTSQPATATLKGGKHLRGDLKWPPEDVKRQTEEENRLRLELAKGPAFRPRRPNKDYTEFFAQHALNSTYPGYKIPPGTQFIRPV